MTIRTLSTCLIVFLAALTSQSQIEEYVDGRDFAECLGTPYLVGMHYSKSQVGFEVKPYETLKYNTIIAEQLSTCLQEHVMVVPHDRVKDIKECDPMVIVARLDTYISRPAVIWQIQGTLTVTLFLFKSPQDLEPFKKVSATATGGRHWGNSVPLENAIRAIADIFAKKCSEWQL